MGAIDLLLTDIIMPKLNGLVLAERLAQHRPETVVRFMSGYVEAGLVSASYPDAVLFQNRSRRNVSSKQSERRSLLRANRLHAA